MFLVLSFDFGNSSSVNLHCMTKNMELALKTYTNYTLGPELLELVEVDEDFNGAYCFYWGKDVPGVRILRSTNRNELGA